MSLFFSIYFEIFLTKCKTGLPKVILETFKSPFSTRASINSPIAFWLQPSNAPKKLEEVTFSLYPFSLICLLPARIFAKPLLPYCPPNSAIQPKIRFLASSAETRSFPYQILAKDCLVLLLQLLLYFHKILQRDYQQELFRAQSFSNKVLQES